MRYAPIQLDMAPVITITIMIAVRATTNKKRLQESKVGRYFGRWYQIGEISNRPSKISGSRWMEYVVIG